MPLYEYECQSCGERTELLQRFNDPPLAACPRCGGGEIKKLISKPAFQFKGTGWYVTDYAGKKAPAEGKSNGSGDAGNPGKGEGAAAGSGGESGGESKDKPGGASAQSGSTSGAGEGGAKPAAAAKGTPAGS